MGNVSALNTAGLQCFDDHCRGRISMCEGEEGEGREGWGGRSQSQFRLIRYIYGEIDGAGEQSWRSRSDCDRDALPGNRLTK
jgi:hypothetical protein